MKCAILMTCFNRVDTTMACLRRLFACTLPKGLAFDVWLNDDGCTDDTAERVANEFPCVNIIKGSGYDYWCGGMRRAWNAAIDSGMDYDGYLWLNDDTYLLPNAFETLFSASDTANAILVGATSSSDGLHATYGGEDGHGFVNPNGSWQSIRQMNGNVVWIPRNVFKRLGNLDCHWTHAMGDYDYSRRAVECGIPVLLSPRFVGTCERNTRIVAWRDPSVSLIARIRNLYSPLGYGEPHKIFRYCLRHDGFFVALKNWFSCHWTVLFPKSRKQCELVTDNELR